MHLSLTCKKAQRIPACLVLDQAKSVLNSSFVHIAYASHFLVILYCVNVSAKYVVLIIEATHPYLHNVFNMFIETLNGSVWKTILMNLKFNLEFSVKHDLNL